MADPILTEVDSGYREGQFVIVCAIVRELVALLSASEQEVLQGQIDTIRRTLDAQTANRPDLASFRSGYEDFLRFFPNKINR